MKSIIAVTFTLALAGGLLPDRAEAVVCKSVGVPKGCTAAAPKAGPAGVGAGGPAGVGGGAAGVGGGAAGGVGGGAAGVGSRGTPIGR